MTLDQEEKQRLAQLGKDRRLSEAVGALDTAAAEFTRVAGDENAEEASVMQAASNYRAAVQRRNIAYDEACGLESTEGESGKATVTHEIDEDQLREKVQSILAEEVAKAQAAEPAPPASEKGNSQPPAGGGQKPEGQESKPAGGKGDGGKGGGKP